MKTIACLLGVLVVVPAPPAARGQQRPRPNVVVILADDLGFSDVGRYGGEVPTPNLDALAADGLRFTHFHNTGLCCPSRAALLTGLCSHEASMGLMTLTQSDLPSYEGFLNDRCATEAEVLNPAGYFTAMVGKWHAGQEHGVTPVTRGFYWSDVNRAHLFLNGRDIGNGAGVMPVP